MLRSVKKVECLGGYRLKLQFDNGKIKIVDLEERLKNAKNLFNQLKDLDYFKKVECDGDSIFWPNGIDFCPDLLYKIGENVAKPVQKRKRAPPKPKAGRRRKSKSYA